VSGGPDEIQRLKRRMARILPMQLKGEFGLRAGEVRWLSGRETYLWIPEKLQAQTTYEIRMDLREHGRTVDGTVTVTEVHSTRKLRLRPGYLVVASYRIPDGTHRAHLNELLVRINPEDLIESSAASRASQRSGLQRPPPPPSGGMDEPSPAAPVPDAADAPSVPSRMRARRQAARERTPSGGSSRGNKIRRDALELTPLGPPPRRRESPAESRTKQTRELGRIPLGPPPRRKPPVADPLPAPVLIEPGPPASLFVQLYDAQQARGAVQGEPPDLLVWLTPDDGLVPGQHASVAFQLPDGRILQLTGRITSKNAQRALLQFPDARPEDLHLLTLSRFA